MCSALSAVKFFAPLKSRTYKSLFPAYPPISIFILFIFRHLQIPFPPTPFFPHLYKTLGVCTLSALCAPNSVPLVLRILATVLLSAACRLLFSLCSLFHSPVVYFQSFTASLPKTRGWGYPAKQWDSHFCLLAAVGAVLRGFTGRSDI